MDMQTIAHYEQNAKVLADRYESIISSLSVAFERVFPAGSCVLDVGFGSGRDMARLLAMGREVFGVDASPAMLAQAVRHHPELAGRLAVGEVPGAFPPFGGAFGGVLCSAMLMHVPVAEYPACARFLVQCLRPGGRMLYSVPTRHSTLLSGEQRDVGGRLFLLDERGQLQAALQAEGLVLQAQWEDPDSLGRGGVVWASVIMQRP